MHLEVRILSQRIDRDERSPVGKLQPLLGAGILSFVFGSVAGLVGRILDEQPVFDLEDRRPGLETVQHLLADIESQTLLSPGTESRIHASSDSIRSRSTS